MFALWSTFAFSFHFFPFSFESAKEEVGQPKNLPTVLNMKHLVPRRFRVSKEVRLNNVF